MELPFNHHAGPNRFEHARFLKKIPTKAENILWGHLRSRQLDGLKFRRQHPISNYIVDFYCHEAKLVVEVDGEIHNQIDNVRYDEARTEALKDLGLRVIRFTNKQVLNDLQKVINEISLKAREK
jgi:Uncharacterized protein conserved in bacteria